MDHLRRQEPLRRQLKIIIILAGLALQLAASLLAASRSPKAIKIVMAGGESLSSTPIHCWPATTLRGRCVRRPNWCGNGRRRRHSDLISGYLSSGPGDSAPETIAAKQSKQQSAGGADWARCICPRLPFDCSVWMTKKMTKRFVESFSGPIEM